MSCKFAELVLIFLLPMMMIMGRVAHAVSMPAVEAPTGMVVSSQALASEVGLAILKKGGNAIDAAVAVGYAQAVVNPCCGNIGGGGFMTIHLADGKDTVINFREMAPKGINAALYLDSKGHVIPEISRQGYLAVGVPGTVMGLEAARKRYGRLSREEVMLPAIRLAREGFILTRADTAILEQSTKKFRMNPEMARLFLHVDGSPLQVGERLIQRELADTLEIIAHQGESAFYKGGIPDAVEKAAKQAGGVIRADDFSAYLVMEQPPITCTYRGYKVISVPPPSSGGTTLCEMLNILEGYDMRALGFHSAASIQVMIEAMRYAYRDRNAFLGDPEMVSNPLERLLSKSYAASLRQKILSNEKTLPVTGVLLNEKKETTHYSAIDKDGNAVSTTYTINGRFGAGVMAPGTGFILNNEIDDFTILVGSQNLYGLQQGVPNLIAPGKRPLSSMSPTLISKDGKIAMILGSPGGSRIMTINLQVMINVIDYGMPLQEAVNVPRIHYQEYPDEVYYEPFGLSPDTLAILRKKRYNMVEQTPWGAAEVILVGSVGEQIKDTLSSGHDASVSGKRRKGFFYGANDERQPAGRAVGY